jgi:hypothetical protein
VSTPSRIELALMATSLALLIVPPASCIARRCWRLLRRRPAVSFFDAIGRQDG